MMNERTISCPCSSAAAMNSTRADLVFVIDLQVRGKDGYPTRRTFAEKASPTGGLFPSSPVEALEFLLHSPK